MAVEREAALRILLIEDAQADYLLIERHLRHSELTADVHWVKDGDELSLALAAKNWDVILTDFKVPGLDFLESLKLIRQKLPDVPVILITGSVGEETAVDLMKEGLNDFVLKDRLFRLVTAIERSIGECAEKKKRAAAERNLAKNEELMRAVTEGTSDAIFVKDSAGRYLLFNQAAAAMTHRQAETVIGRDDSFLFQPETVAKIREQDQAIMAEGRLLSEEEWVTTQSGERFAVLTTKGPVLDQDGRITGVFGISRDITERKNIERAQQFNQRLLELVHNFTDIKVLIDHFIREIKSFVGCEAVGIRVLDDHGNIPYQAYEGFSRRFFEKESPLSIKSNSCMCINVIKGDTDRNLPFYTPGGSFYMNGTTRFLATVSEKEKGATRNVCNQVGYESVALVPFRSEGQVIGLIHVADRRDNMVPLAVVELLERAVMQLGTAFQRAHAQTKLRESEERYRLLSLEYKVLLDNLPDGLIHFSPRLEMHWINGAARKMFNLADSDTLRGKSCRAALLNCEEFCASCPVVRALSSGRNEIGVFSRKNDDRKFEIRAVPMLDESRKVASVIAIIRDVSAHHKLEAQLHQAQKMESIGTFAGGIAHDFNNILTAILGYGEIALETMERDDPNRENINVIIEAGLQASHLTKDLLLFSRKQLIDKRELDLNSVVTHVEKFIRRIIGEDIQCETNLAQQSIPIFADGHQLEQVLMNFATNARDAMPRGGTFSISTEIFELDHAFRDAHGFGTPGNYCLITVADTGLGMDKQTADKIFEPFFTTKERGKGTGLGLAVVYGIIKEHQGYINVYSEPQRGTVFKIYLPVSEAENQPVPTYVEQATAQGGHETILVAEDETAVRRLVTTLLKRNGYTVIEAVDGEDAVNQFNEHRDNINLLLFDLIMPKMNGKIAMDAIRRIAPGIKGIFVSGYAPDNLQDKNLIDNRTELLFKPVSPKELLRSIRKILDAP